MVPPFQKGGYTFYDSVSVEGSEEPKDTVKSMLPALDDLKRLMLVSKKGDRIRLDQVASFKPEFGPTSVDKMNKFRYIFVKAKVFDGTLEGKVKEVDELLKSVEMPDGYFYKFGGEYPTLRKAKLQLSLAIGISIILIFMILASLFQSYYQPLIILFSIPLSVVGVWGALTLTDKPLSQPVLLGMIMLGGIVVNNAIILIDHTNQLRAEGLNKLRAIITASQNRLRPILMTTASTVLGFIPLAFGFGESADLWSPLAITVVGGLSSSTLFTIFVVPNVYVALEDTLNRLSKFLPFLKVQEKTKKVTRKRKAAWS